MMFVVVFALHLVGLMLVVLAKFSDRTVGEDEVAAQLAEGERPNRSSTDRLPVTS